MNNYRKAIDDLEVAEHLLHRASKELLDYYSETTLSVDKDCVKMNKADYNDSLRMARKLILESYME